MESALNLREEASSDSRVVARYAPGTILDNPGCRLTDDRVWCDVQEMGGGPRGHVAAEYLEPAVSPGGRVATGPDDSALRADHGDFDETGEIPCAMSAGQPTVRCEFGVSRAGGGYATVVITRPDGRSRAIYFRMGRRWVPTPVKRPGRVQRLAGERSQRHPRGQREVRDSGRGGSWQLTPRSTPLSAGADPEGAFPG